MKFRSAAEARLLGAPLVRLFVTGLARAPSASELVPLVGRLRAGDDLGEAAAAMAASAEFVARHGPDGPPDHHYVRALFWAIDGQDPPGLERDRLLAQPNASRASLLAQVSQFALARDTITLEQGFYHGNLPPDDDVAYQLWLDGGGEQPLPFAGEPPTAKVSIVITAPAGRPDLLDETLASLAAQTSPHWEALVVGQDAPAHADPRIRHIAASANAIDRAVLEASGVLIGFIEASDLLAPQAIEAAARLATANPGLRLVYTDEDCIAGDGARTGAMLKPGWSPDLMLSGDVLGQLVLFNRQRMLDAGGLSAAAGGFARLDLALRLSVDAAPGEIVHQPGILFHRGRAPAGRPAPFPRSRASNGIPSLDAVVDGFLARHRPGLVRGSQRRGSRIWPSFTAALPSPAPRVSVIIPTRDRAPLLASCLSGLLGATDYPDIEVLVVDNGSVEADALALLEQLAADGRVRVLREGGPFNWSALTNRAAGQATGDVLLLLDPDVSVLEPGWLRSMVGHAMRPGVGVVGARLLFPDGTLQHGGMLLSPRVAPVHAFTGAAADEPGYLAQVMVLRDVSAVTGACLAIRRALFAQLGGLEQDQLYVAWSDVDLCLRTREAGYHVLFDPDATLTRHKTEALDETLAQQARLEHDRNYMRQRWPVAAQGDPFLNPALRAEPDGLAFRAVTCARAIAASPAPGLVEELPLELASLKHALRQSRAETDRLRRAWPRAELQRLYLDLAAKDAANARLSAERELLAARVVGLPPWLIRTALHLRIVPRLWRVLRRLAAVIRRTPHRRALLRQRRADYAVIAASPVFDRAWYRTSAMDGDQLTDPVSHYLWRGAVAGRDPHALFDSAWYAARVPDLGGEDPFAHYIRLGMAADVDPHPLFDTAYYLEQAPEAAGRALLHHMHQPAHGTCSPTPLFDPVDYPEGLAHWARAGAKADRDPHALFATAWYRRTTMGNDRTRNPLAHWVREGRGAGLPPNPHGLEPATPLHLPDPGPNPAVSIVAQRGRTGMDTTRTLLSLAHNTAGSTFEVILAGDGPPCAFGEAHRSAPDRRQAALRARGSLLVFLGAGAVVHAGWLPPLLATVQADPGAGAVGCKTLAMDGSLRSAGASLADDGLLRHDSATDPSLPHHAFGRVVDAVDPGAMLVRRDAWDTVAGLDDGYETGAYAAAHFALALRRRGWRTLIQPASVVTLPDAISEAGEADRRRLLDRWAADLSRQPPPGDRLAGWLAATRRVLVLVDAVPQPGSPAAQAIAGLLEPGTRAALHPRHIDPDCTRAWEQRGLEIIRSPTPFEDWLALFGVTLDEVWSFRDPSAVPAAALLQGTGARLLQWAPGTILPPWCDAALALSGPDAARAAA